MQTVIVFFPSQRFHSSLLLGVLLAVTVLAILYRRSRQKAAATSGEGTEQKGKKANPISYIRGGEGPVEGTGEQGDETRTRGQGGAKAWVGWNWKGLEETFGSETTARKGNIYIFFWIK